MLWPTTNYYGQYTKGKYSQSLLEYRKDEYLAV